MLNMIFTLSVNTADEQVIITATFCIFVTRLLIAICLRIYDLSNVLMSRLGCSYRGAVDWKK